MCDSKGCCGGGMCTTSWIAKILLIVGGLNWGLIGAAMLMNNGSDWNVVHMILGQWPMVEGVVYVLVGIAAVVKIFGCRCNKCMTGCANCTVHMDGNMNGKVENKM